MSDINLLPTDLKTGKDVAKVKQVINRITIVLAGIVLACGLLGGGYLYLLSRSASEALQRQEELKVELKNNEPTEQKLVLIKDRLVSAQRVLSFQTTFPILKKYDNFLVNLPENVSFSEFALSSDVSKITVSIPDSDTLSQVLLAVDDTSKFEKVLVENLTFNVTSGFNLTLNLF